jgi:Zn-dependent M16 (insulinase) family peptidase
MILHAQPFNSFSDYTQGKIVHGFRTEAIYYTDNDLPIGARFIHEKTGFTFDLLRIQSVPQAFIWVRTFPTSDKGEPHTQEHLLLGKGNEGRRWGNMEAMSLATSSAFTEQWHTCYDFFTNAGADTYYKLLDQQLNALLHPDYTDEEIQREVRNFGIVEDQKDGSLRLEEKGTVYNEMVSTYQNPWVRTGNVMGHEVLYGNHHPLAYESGGSPDGLREITPKDIRIFHDRNYHLANMGMIGAFPDDMPLDDILKRTDSIITTLEPDGGKTDHTFMMEKDLPAPVSAAPGTIKIVLYPDKNDQNPSPIEFAWLPDRTLDIRQFTLLNLFMENLAGDATTDLYKMFIDTKTRVMDIGTQGVFGNVSSDQGNSPYIGLSDVSADNINEQKISAIRTKIVEHIAHIASLPDNSPELLEFNTRLHGLVVQMRRNMNKLINTPPGFGFRGTGDDWMVNMQSLDKIGGFKRYVTLKPVLDSIEHEISSGKNIWHTYLTDWKMLNELPVAVAAKPSPALVQKEAKERDERIASEVARLKKQYGTTTDEETIRRYKQNYNSATAAIDQQASRIEDMHFVASPPLSVDDQLHYQVDSVQGSVRRVASTFDNMTSATVGIAFRLSPEEISSDDYVYLSLLPSLLTQTGVIKDGEPMSYEKVSEAEKEEILSLDAYYSINPVTKRYEMIIKGAGNNTPEAEKALGWMELTLLHANWRPDNLPRMRDVVDQSLANWRQTMQGSEESWVNNPARAYEYQNQPIFLSMQSFLTQEHNAQRLRWLLRDAGTPKERQAISEYFDLLKKASAHVTRTDLQTLLGVIEGDSSQRTKLNASLKQYADAFDVLDRPSQANATEAAKDIEQDLAGIPDDALNQDWQYLCMEIKHDLLVPSDSALARLDALRKIIVRRTNARIFEIGSSATQSAIEGKVTHLVSLLETSSATASIHTPANEVIKARLKERMPSATSPLFVGLVNPNTTSGVFINSAPLTSYKDTSREKILDYLASGLFAGHGSHGIFMKTWGAGLAYSNGIGNSLTSGDLRYYAERCPELPQTIRFVIGVLKDSPHDPRLAEYAVAGAFGDSRAASEYETRGEAMAADIEDGLAVQVPRFHRAVLNARTIPDLSKELYSRMNTVYGKALPGYAPGTLDTLNGKYFVIGNDKQCALYQDYLYSAVGQSATLYRLYPRDYWMTLPADELKN